MNDNLLKRTRFKLEINKKGHWTIVRKKGLLWIFPAYFIFFFGIYESIKWIENMALLSIQVAFLGFIPFVIILGFLHIIVYKLEVSSEGISKRDFKFPLPIKNENWTKIEHIEIQTINSKIENKGHFNLLINSEGSKIVLLTCYAKNDNMNIEKMTQLGKEIATIINKPFKDKQKTEGNNL